MAKELLLYGPVFNFSAASLIDEIEEAKGDEIVLRINSEGGSPEDSWGIIAKFEEHAKDKKIKVDGIAHSMLAFFLTYVPKGNVTALDVSSFMFHRAGFPDFLEKDSDFMTQARIDNLNHINGKLRAALEAKVDVDKFKEITGVSMDELFSMEGRVEANLTAEEALEVGLVDEIKVITPEQNSEIQALMYKVAAKGAGIEPKKEETPKPKKEEKPASQSKNKQNYKDMSIEALKSENPELYKEVLAEGTVQEKDRVGAWMAYYAIDPEAVTKGIKGGDILSETAKAEFAIKGISAEALKKVKKDSNGEVQTEEVTDEEKTEKEKATAEFEKSVDKSLGLDKKEEEKKS